MSTTARTGMSRGRAFTTDARPPEPGAASPGGQEVVKAATTAVAASDYAEDAGAGLEGITQSEMLIPFIRMIQSNSAQCTQGSPAYDESVRPGMLYHSALGEYYTQKRGLGFIPAYRDSSFTEWVPIDAGGGFRGGWSHDDPRIPKLKEAQGSFKKLKLPDGNELVETYSFYGVVVPRTEEGVWLTDEATNGVISFTSTQIRKYRQMLTRLQALAGTPPRFPMFAWRWQITTQPEKNKSGNYFGWRIGLDGESSTVARLAPDNELYLMARQLNQLLKTGVAKADYANSGIDKEGGADAGGPIDQGGDPGASAEEIPF